MPSPPASRRRRLLRLVLMPLSILQIAAIFSWTGLCVAGALIARWLLGHERVSLGMARWMWAPGVLLIAGLRIRSVHGADSIDHDRPYFIVSNHQSFLDIPVLFRTLPIDLRFVAKHELRKLPFVSHYIDAMGMIWVDRKNKERSRESIRAVGTAVASGRTVLLFPEGTRHDDDRVHRFKSGMLSASIGSGVEVLPVAVVGTADGMPPRSLSILPTVVDVRIGRPLSTDGYEPDERRPLADAARDAVAALHAESLELRKRAREAGTA
ncbi:MAG: lysophospholipid acyltransferase family protein [Acidobacteriota bacterium]